MVTQKVDLYQPIVNNFVGGATHGVSKIETYALLAALQECDKLAVRVLVAAG